MGREYSEKLDQIERLDGEIDNLADQMIQPCGGDDDPAPPSAQRDAAEAIAAWGTMRLQAVRNASRAMNDSGDDAFGDGETRYGTSGAGGPHSLAGAPPALAWTWAAIGGVSALGAISAAVAGAAMGGLVETLAVQAPANVQGGAAVGAVVNTAAGGITTLAAGFIWAIRNYGD